MFHISPNAVVSIGFNVIEPYIRENFEYVMIEGKDKEQIDKLSDTIAEVVRERLI